MKEAFVTQGPTVEIVDSPIPEPNDDQLLIKVVVSGSNPKDWKLPQWRPDTRINQGDDIAGEVVKVGKNVFEFKPGDRVAALHEMTKPGGSFAEYAIAWQHTTFHIPEAISFEEAATIPLAAATAAVGLYRHLGLPEPWAPAKEPIPLVIYGGGTAVGAFAIQLARRSNIHPLIVVAGKSGEFVRPLLDESKGDVLVDYRGGADAVVEGIKAAAKGASLKHAYDAVSEAPTPHTLGRVLEDGGLLTTVLPVNKPEEEIPPHVKWVMTMVGEVHDEDAEKRDFAFVALRYLAKGLAEGWLKPHPHRVVAGGLGGVQEALEQLMGGRVSAFKFVFRIGETEGAGKD
ncbi:hypothetical protein GGTG_08848 [Gaeumannomyces tritici R3-111a-1]|uniref:Enoyl reductase (ER) domain-containing protein n=1 Tax=Gaeumannomyces tritici (strain R3-111a-1) TaxID=644352 RepID=J3P5Q8_GAET3|nr:hypothetical protein GGTG_08848 [Gaeumannomyces tritici R3-111a-1]EJT75010.1 hypothetical protein GGTG_08848 [Gaeumannomyces tritici R3-111a-1]